jgi:parvulin-like peptidyl-prolyl isomerase
MKLMTTLLRSLSLGLILTLALPAAASAEPFQVNGKAIPDKVASVNGIALDSQLLISEIKVYRLMNRQQNKELTEKEVDEFSHQALARLVDQELIFQEARKKNILIKPELIEQRIQEVRKQFPSKQMLQTALDMQGLTMDLLKTKFEKQMVEEALIREEVAPNVKVNDPEVEAFYKKHQDRFQTPEKYEVHHIFAAALQSHARGETISDPALRKKAERLKALLDEDAAEKIRGLDYQLQDGADFAKLAKEHSEDGKSGAKGGSWGTVTLSELPESLATELKKLKKNETSGPIRSPYGYHILKWTKIIPAGHVKLSEVKTDIMNALLREKTLSEHQKMVSKMRTRADIQLFY